jgi:outer membrane protein OmpA-like peptidoglycan-associated protein
MPRIILQSKSKPNLPKFLSLLTICLLITGLLAKAQSPEVDFDQVQALLDQATQVRADVFSKNKYDSGKEAFQQAQTDKNAGKNAKTIARSLTEAQTDLQVAIIAAQSFQDTFPDLVSAYDAAQNAEADTLSPKTYRQGLDYFSTVVSKVEKGDLDAARKSVESAQKSLRQAELEAIKKQILSEVWELEVMAQKADCPKMVPTLFSIGQSARSDAEQAIEADRYDRPNGVLLADHAAYTFHHAIFICERIKVLQKDKNGWENEILRVEDQFKSIDDQLALESKFDRELPLSTQSILSAIKSVQEDRRRLQRDIEKRDETIGNLEAEVSKLKGQTEKYLAELESKREQIKKQQEFDAKIQRVTTLFTSAEGSVLRTMIDSTDAIVIRLSGLMFPSGSAKIRKEDFPLLEKAKQAVGEFPNYTAEVQGHTDSQGDEAKNQQLSQDRAASVADYLIKGLNLPEGSIKYIGFGETKPLASNELAAGRNQNRRIEIVLKKKI